MTVQFRGNFVAQADLGHERGEPASGKVDRVGEAII